MRGCQAHAEERTILLPSLSAWRALVTGDEMSLLFRLLNCCDSIISPVGWSCGRGASIHVSQVHGERPAHVFYPCP